jgi:hypothetical protein
MAFAAGVGNTLREIRTAPWGGLFRRHPFAFTTGLAVAAVMTAGAAFSMGWGMALLVGGLFVLLALALAQEQKQIAQHKPEALDQTPWQKVMQFGALAGILFGLVFSWLHGFPLPKGVFFVGWFMIAGVTLAIENEHWTRNGYGRFVRLWPRYVAASIGAMLLTFGLAASGAAACWFLLSLFPITPELVNWLFENVARIQIRPELLTTAAAIIGILFGVLGGLADRLAAAQMAFGSPPVARGRARCRNRRKHRRDCQNARAARRLRARLRHSRLRRRGRGRVGRAGATRKPRAGLRRATGDSLRRYPHAVLLAVVVLGALSLATRGLLALLQAYSPPLANTDEALGGKTPGDAAARAERQRSTIKGSPCPTFAYRPSDGGSAYALSQPIRNFSPAPKIVI